MISDNIKNQCIDYLFDKYSISLNNSSYLVEFERDNSYIFQPENLIFDYIINSKEKNDYLLLQRILSESQRNLSVYSNGSEYRVNDLNWEYNPLNKNNASFSFLKDFYKEHLSVISNKLSKTDLYLNNQFEEVCTSLTVDHNIRSSINNENFNTKVLEIRIGSFKKHFSRNHIITVGSESGTISLRFLSRNKDKVCFFNENIRFNNIYIKDLMNPLNILCSELDLAKYTVIEVLIPFKIKSGIACFEDLKMNISSKHLPIVPLFTGTDFSIDTVYRSIEFRKLFNAFDQEYLESPLNENELYTIIDNYKLLKY